jgi:hypothetical protein
MHAQTPLRFIRLNVDSKELYTSQPLVRYLERRRGQWLRPVMHEPAFAEEQPIEAPDVLYRSALARDLREPWR